MKNTALFLIIMLSHGIFAQNSQFKIELYAPGYEKDSLFIGPPMSSGNVQKIYGFTTDVGPNVTFMKDFNTIKIKKNSNFKISGKILYPQPVAISYYDAQINGGYYTKPLFLEKGNINVEVKKADDHLEYILHSGSPANTEYKAMKAQLKTYDEKLKPFQENAAKDIEAKQAFLQKYIAKNPGSYVAFWEIVSDFSQYGFNTSYLKSLALFSPMVQKSFSYKEFKKMMITENSTNAGGKFPEIIFNEKEKISGKDFPGSSLTLVDYWSTTCKPCIQDMPKLVALYAKYKSQGVNFISVTDEKDPKKIALAKNILEKNQATWKNYFDTRKEFPKKLNASGYPLQILVDNKGTIIAREMGELNAIEVKIKSYLEKQ
ncbi:TlpA disulfide reductase family protein [uncultured Chryseobacterium sp.]|uniref:TlpA disulfide reductase family protein n=1 Tax=uncultured Chryseobacterium sp. TaxID=259322 RepID=UPI0025F47205|nr:TlpA disulfide reductase family protein [uncultured Chryseobacterium sp.]